MGFFSGIFKSLLSGIFFVFGLAVGGYVLYRIIMHFLLG